MDLPTCHSCGATITEIVAVHSYTIEYSEEQEAWVKTIGEAIYSCSNCEAVQDTDDIAEILRQVDEL